ncbi:MAG: DUF2290 domain-containing protein [Pseudomonadales bacterium]
MTLLSSIEKSTSSIIRALIEKGLAEQFTMPSVASNNKFTGDIGFASGVDIAWAMKDQPYTELYTELIRRQQFHAVLPDGGALQFLYKVRLNKIAKHRLAFYPNPNLKPFDTDALRYLQDSVWGHVVSEFQMPVVVRLDYENSSDSYKAIQHSASHLTLGQYPNCRIPVSSPFTPWAFTELILRNFYSKAFEPLSRADIHKCVSFEECLMPEEMNHLHLRLPA